MSTPKTKKTPATGSAAGMPATSSMLPMPVEGDMQAVGGTTDGGDAMPGQRPGVSYADQAAGEAAGGMPGGGMPQEQASQGMAGSSNMPAHAGGMGTEHDGERGGGGGSGGSGGGMGGAGGGGQGGGTPQVRTCATMDVHRRLLSEDPAYASVRDEIENLAGLYEADGGIAGRSGVTQIPVVVHVV